MDQTAHLTGFSEGYGDDPPASILTTSQREFLFGERELEGAQARAMERRIRERIRVGFWDLLYLARYYPLGEIEKTRPDSGETVPPFHALAGFLYYLQPEDGLVGEDMERIEGEETEPLDSVERDRRASWAESDVERGIRTAIRQREGVTADVDVSITVERDESLEELAEQDLTDLSRETLDDLLIGGAISKEEYGQAVSEKLEGL
jgi:hypothetical protein